MHICSTQPQLEQLECLRFEDTPRRLMITHTIESYWIQSQKSCIWKAIRNHDYQRKLEENMYKSPLNILPTDDLAPLTHPQACDD